jgi:hypothetical protein
MPDQPADPLHYEMKIPPEPKDATLHKEQQRSGSDEVTAESNDLQNRKDDANPSRSPAR